MEGNEQKEEKKFIEELVKDQPATKALQKLNRKPLEISVYRHTSLVGDYEKALALIDEQIPNAKDNDVLKELEETKKEVLKKLEDVEKDKIEGVLTPLLYRDMQDIKAAVTEAVVHFQEYKFDIEVIMARVIAEERYMTVFCALKRKDNPSKRYFTSLEEIVLMDDATIFDIYKRWEDHFVLTVDELKN